MNYYQGIASNRAKMGDAARPIQANDIKETVSMMHLVSFLFLLLCLLFRMAAEAI